MFYIEHLEDGDDFPERRTTKDVEQTLTFLREILEKYDDIRIRKL